ncbi:hypothetical protein RJT34_24053 [Clitoria ternatea]|uniref:Uncharacterized protein n=1 Tax=Clitoria ternatea TaxID=43366 RepID=A0AAN9FM83_CLITE
MVNNNPGQFINQIILLAIKGSSHATNSIQAHFWIVVYDSGTIKINCNDLLQEGCINLLSQTIASDEQYFVFGKMHEFSAVDGFLEISDCLAEMIKYVANEPSVGFYFIQQHTQNAVPNVIKLKNDVTGKSHETTLRTEDLEDAVTMMKSMKECGFPIVNEMIRDIKNSLVTMTTKQPKQGLIHRSASNFQTDRTGFWGNYAVYDQEGSEKMGNYFSSVFSFSKQKTNSFKWPELDSMKSINSETEKPHAYPNVPLSDTSVNTAASSQGMEANKQPQLNLVEDESQPEVTGIGNKLLLVSEKYDDFKASKQAKLEEWLEGSNNHEDNCLTGDEKML